MTGWLELGVLGLYTIITAISAVYSRQTARAAIAALHEQAQATRAETYLRVRHLWAELDELMVAHVDVFGPSGGALKPARFISEDGLPNPDRRLYLTYRFFGVVEEMVMLVEEYRFLSRETLDSYRRSVGPILKVPIVQQFWTLIQDEYPEQVRTYVAGFLPATEVPRQRAPSVAGDDSRRRDHSV